jgi:hypothetical protein
MKSEHSFADESMLRQYLLGELREPLQRKVEDRLFTEPEYCEQLSVVEEDLIDSYVRGGLPAGERLHFESNFLSSPRRRERLEFAQTWVANAGAAATPEPGFRPLLFLRSPWLLSSVCGASSILLVVLGASVIWLNREFAQERSDRLRLAAEIALVRAGAESQIARGETSRGAESQIARAETSRPPAWAAPLATFLLRPGVERSIGAAGQRLVIPRGTYPIQLELEQAARKSYPSYEVRIEDFEGNEIWSKAQIRSGRGVSSNLIRVTLPSSVLRPGVYRISISGVTADGSAEELAEYYAFQAIGR